MPKVSLHFEADTADALSTLVLDYVRSGLPLPPLNPIEPPADAEHSRTLQQLKDSVELEDAKAKAKAEAEADAKAKAKAAKKTAPAPAPEPEPAVSAPVGLPSLEILKGLVTQAVRTAQKGEGSRTILDLLPEFKKATGLNFVMEAKDEHRKALNDLVVSAGLGAV
jgi:hypothetical protein